MSLATVDATHARHRAPVPAALLADRASRHQPLSCTAFHSLQPPPPPHPHAPPPRRNRGPLPGARRRTPARCVGRRRGPPTAGWMGSRFPGGCQRERGGRRPAPSDGCVPRAKRGNREINSFFTEINWVFTGDANENQLDFHIDIFIQLDFHNIA